MQAGKIVSEKLRQILGGFIHWPGGFFYSEVKSLQKTAESIIFRELFADTDSTSLQTICSNRA